LCVGNEWGNPEKKTGHEMTAVISCPVSAFEERKKGFDRSNPQPLT